LDRLNIKEKIDLEQILVHCGISDGCFKKAKECDAEYPTISVIMDPVMQL